MTVQGSVDPAFQAVADAFAANIATGAEIGAGVAVFHRGRPVVDLWGGWADAPGGRPWQRDTVVTTYSTVKPMAAACALVLVDRGRLELDAPVARWWPEFAQAGKDRITVRELLSHRAGLVTLDDDVPGEELYDWDRLVARLAAAAPRRPAGTVHGEHALFYGHLIGELVRRVDGRGIREFFATEIAGPWGMDVQIGLRERDRGRVATVHGLDALFPDGVAGGSAGSDYHRALANPPGMLLAEVVNSPRWWEADIPAVNGHATAMGVARFYQGLLGEGELDGVRILSAELCRELRSVQSSGPDAFLERHVDWGLGVQLEADGSFGHGGLGGSFGYAHPGLALAVGYVLNRLGDGAAGDALVEAAEACARTA